jgi:hypothetical protein
MDRESDFELDEKDVHPFHGKNFRPSSRWSEPEIVHQEHKIHPYHANCTTVAPETNPQSNWFGGSIINKYAVRNLDRPHEIKPFF